MILCGLVLTRSLVVRRKANKLKQSLKQFPNKTLTHESTDQAVQIQAPVLLYGLGVGTATDLSHEVSASMFSCLDIICHPLTDG